MGLSNKLSLGLFALSLNMTPALAAEMAEFELPEQEYPALRLTDIKAGYTGNGILKHVYYTYKGAWLESQFSGVGELTTKSGYKFLGEFKANQPYGIGVLTDPDGNKYFVEFEEGLGRFSKNDKIYECRWESLRFSVSEIRSVESITEPTLVEILQVLSAEEPESELDVDNFPIPLGHYVEEIDLETGVTRRDKEKALETYRAFDEQIRGAIQYRQELFVQIVEYAKDNRDLAQLLAMHETLARTDAAIRTIYGEMEMIERTLDPDDVMPQKSFLERDLDYSFLSFDIPREKQMDVLRILMRISTSDYENDFEAIQEKITENELNLFSLTVVNGHAILTLRDQDGKLLTISTSASIHNTGGSQTLTKDFEKEYRQIAQGFEGALVILQAEFESFENKEALEAVLRADWN